MHAGSNQTSRSHNAPPFGNGGRGFAHSTPAIRPGLSVIVLALCCLAPGLSITGVAAAQVPDKPVTRCGDFLARMHLKAPGMRYIGCSYLPRQQGKPLRATYQVPGALAAQTERHLVMATGMALLQRSCCQWDGPRHSFRGRDGREYDITMVSDESTATAERPGPASQCSRSSSRPSRKPYDSPGKRLVRAERHRSREPRDLQACGRTPTTTPSPVGSWRCSTCRSPSTCNPCWRVTDSRSAEIRRTPRASTCCPGAVLGPTSPGAT